MSDMDYRALGARVRDAESMGVAFVPAEDARAMRALIVERVEAEEGVARQVKAGQDEGEAFNRLRLSGAAQADFVAGYRGAA